MTGFRYPGEPFPKQVEALNSEAFAVLYGGALGGGKTEWLLQCASLYSHRYPGARICFVRRNYKELMQAGGPLDRAVELWAKQTGVTYKVGAKTLKAPNDSMLEFRHCENKGDELHFQGSEYDVFLVDEAGLFEREQLLYFIERIRGQKTQKFRLSANPGGPGHRWLYDTFVRSTDPEYAFVPALASDNPMLPEGYYERLEASMSGISKAHRLYGDWEAIEETGFFTKPVMLGLDPGGRVRNRVRAWDLAVGGDYTVGTLVERRADVWPDVVVLDQYAQKTSAEKVIALLEKTRDQDGPGTTTVIETEPGSSSRILLDYLSWAQGIPADRNKQQRARPVADAVERGRIGLLPGAWNMPFIEELLSFPSASHDDRVDSFVHAVNYILNNEVFLLGF